MISNASVANAGGILAGGSVFDCSDKDLYWVLFRSEVDDFEGVFKEIDGSGLFSSATARAHKVVCKSLYDVNFGLTKFSMFVSSHAVRNVNWFERDVPLDPWILYFNPVKTPLPEKFDLLSLAQMRHLDKPSGLRSLYLRLVQKTVLFLSHGLLFLTKN